LGRGVVPVLVGWQGWCLDAMKVVVPWEPREKVLVGQILGER